MGARRQIVVTVDSAGSKSLFESEKSDVIVGRSKKADLRLAYEGMSREHFALQEKEGILFIKDLGSANGTMVNGSLLGPQKYHKLAPKDKIEVKGLALKIEAKILEFPSPAAKTPPKPAPKPKAKVKPEPLPAYLDAPEMLDDFDDRELALAREIIIEAPREPEKQEDENKNTNYLAQAQAMELLSSAEQEAKEILKKAQIQLEQVKEVEHARWQIEWKVEAEQELARLREKIKAEEMAEAQFHLQQQQMKLEKEWQAKVAQENEKQALDAAELQKRALASMQGKADKLIEEAETNAQRLIEEARKMAREVRDKVYQETLALKDQALQSYETQRGAALVMYEDTLARASADAERLLKEAKQEIEKRESKANEFQSVSKLQAEESLSQSESKAQKIIQEAAAQAQHLIEGAKVEERQLKEDAEKLLKNAYATALAMATASDGVNFIADFPELKTVEFRKIEDLHHLGLEGLGNLKQTTGHELADVQKRKIAAMAEEERNLRASMYERVKLEAQEEALRIQQGAEKSAEEILAQAYTLSKRLSAETQHKYLADKARIEQEIKHLDEQYQSSNHLVTELKAAIHEGELKKRYLAHELEQLSLDQATCVQKLGSIREELTSARREHAEFLQEIKQSEASLRERVQEQREERVASETQFLATKKEWERELSSLGEEVVLLREEKTLCLQVMQESQSQLASAESEVRRLEEEKQNFEALLRQYEEKSELAQGRFEQLVILESELRQKVDAGILAVQKAEQNENELKTKCQQMLQEARAEKDQLHKHMEEERNSLDMLKMAQEKMVREEAEELRKQICDEARAEGQKICAQLIDEGTLQKAQMLEKVRQMQERITATNLEMAKKEQEMKAFQEQKIMEAQREAIALTESVQLEIHEARQRTEEEGRKLLADVHARAEQILSQAVQQKEMEQDKIQDEIAGRRRLIDSELESYKADQSREIAQIKIRELETLKRREQEFNQKWETIREDAVQEISENLRVNLLVKIPDLPPEKMEQFKNSFIGSIQEVVRNALHPPNQEAGPKAKGILQGTGKVSRKAKIFWLKLAASIVIPILLLIIHFAAPNFYPALYQSTLGKIVSGDSYSNKYVENEMALSRNRPKFNPATTPGFKANYTDNILYTEGYRDLVLNAKFIEEWTKDCNHFLEQELRMSDETIVSLVSFENNMHEQLVPLFLKINPDFEKEGVARMRETEGEYYPKIKALFPSEEKFARFYKFKEDYFFQKSAAGAQ
ncbi:MAG: hypothetical protein A2X86_13420 [Bdellovibrionales bacterium GWA2_49_15]|nr:MAG: hypothetical protein A2X86_13420 [Bdellovibrionales bacterium GWA2_49_15]HAZ13525.1 hypothetical protein [Bdellovibrionales bacterium]